MNILIISNKAIYPRDGGNLAIMNLATGYANQGHKVVILNMITYKHQNRPEDIDALKKLNIEIIGVKVDTHISFFKLIKNIVLSNKPYNLERFISPEFSQKIIHLISTQSFDFIQLESLYILPYFELIRKYHKGNIIYRSHNIEYIIWKENANYSKSLLKKIYFKFLAKRLKNYEQKIINRYDIILPIAQTDAFHYNQFKNNKPLLVTPFGINTAYYTSLSKQKTIKKDTPSLLFLGSLDWIPNQMGLIWFINHVLPRVCKTIPEIKLNVAGRNAPGWLIKKLYNRNIHYFGTIDNATDFILTDGIFIVPLFVGSGMRVKIIEAMALGKCIISTPKGIEGLNITANEIMIAETADQFTDSIINLIRNSEKQNELGVLAQQRANSDYDSDTIARNVLNFINQH